MKALKFALEIGEKLPPMPTLTKEELLSLRVLLAWFRRYYKKRDMQSFMRAVDAYKKATGEDLCTRLDDIIEAEKEVAKKAIDKSAYAGRTEINRLEDYVKFKDWCQKKEE